MLGQSSLAFGGAISLAGAIGLYGHGTTTIRCYEVMAWPFDAPEPPPKLSIPPFASASPALFAVGMVMFAIGLGCVLKQGGATGLGRTLLTLGGIGTVAASTLIGWSLLEQRDCFAEIASSARMPDFDRLESHIRTAGQSANLGRSCLIAALAAILIAGLVLPKRRLTTDSPRSLSRLGQLLLIGTGLLAVSFGVLVCWAWWNYGAALAASAAAHVSPRPAELAAVIVSTITYLLASFLVLLLCGLFQIADGAFLCGENQTTQ